MQPAAAAAAATGAAAPLGISIRIIDVAQNLFPGPGPAKKSSLVDIGLGWASFPKTLTVDGKDYAVSTQQGRTKEGGTITRHQATLPILSDGVHYATVTLDTGIKVQVELFVHSSH